MILISNNKKNKIDKIFNLYIKIKYKKAKSDKLKGLLKDILMNISEKILNTAFLIWFNTLITKKEFVKIFFTAKVKKTINLYLYIAVPILNVIKNYFKRFLRKDK